MSRIARISGGVKATLRNLPSMFFNEQSRVSSSTTHHLGGLPTNSNSNSNSVKKKKSNFWKLAPSFFNPNVGIIKHRPLLMSSLRPFTTSEDKEGGKDHQVENAQFQFQDDPYMEKMKIVKVLISVDKRQNLLVDGAKVLSMVLQEWKKSRPNYELDYMVDDFVNLIYMVVAEKTTGNKISIAERTILKLLADYDDPEFADQVLFEAMDFWSIMISVQIEEIEKIVADTINLLGKHDKKVKRPIPLAVAEVLRAYFDDPVSMVEEIDAQIKKAVLATKKNGEAKLQDEEEIQVQMTFSNSVMCFFKKLYKK